jgi:hypothetical protein
MNYISTRSSGSDPTTKEHQFRGSFGGDRGSQHALTDTYNHQKLQPNNNRLSTFRVAISRLLVATYIDLRKLDFDIVML